MTVKNYILALVLLFTQFANANEKTLLIFSADWCKYCQLAKNDIENDSNLSKIIKNYEIIQINYDEDKDFIKVHNIKTIPTFVIFENGKETSRQVGYRNPKQLYRFLK